VLTLFVLPAIYALFFGLAGKPFFRLPRFLPARQSPET
jgi:hypothetical protein